jgi:ABC-type polysaccharide/polyol phosphate transport system ATPase subunit
MTMYTQNNKVAVKIENISKLYTMRTKNLTLRQVASNLVKDGFRLKRDQQFYALRDVNITIKRGEGVAVLGRNGSGKTTLLQLLANVMSPTSGTITIDGRYTALLGATLGMMPTMTGLENIHLMAAMYGVRLDQEPDLLETIVRFADIGEFIDTYVKNYSSGMKARLGFSVAIHALPEIVFIDEVLAVGDIHFKQKCDKKIRQLREDGRTFVIVTHNVSGVEGLCERAVWLNEGVVEMDGPLQEVWEEYRSFRIAQRQLRLSN